MEEELVTSNLIAANPGFWLPYISEERPHATEPKEPIIGWSINEYKNKYDHTLRTTVRPVLVGPESYDAYVIEYPDGSVLYSELDYKTGRFASLADFGAYVEALKSDSPMDWSAILNKPT